MENVPSSPIADLSYRNYDGPLSTPLTRWWPIAKMTLQLSLKKKWFWILGVLGSFYYLIVMVILYFASSANSGNTPGRMDPLVTLLGNTQWHDQFLYGFSYAQLILMIIAITIGSPTIASDNFANALLIYLSRPVTKIDYLFGKWLGIFIAIAGISFLPMFIFFAYGGMGYTQYGFFSQDHLLIFKVLLLSCITGAFHASFSIGISSLFKQPRYASGTYASLYFLTLFFTEMVSSLYQSDPSNRTELLRNLFYTSIDGAQIGMAKWVIGADGGRPFFQNAAFETTVPRPDLWWIFILYFGLCAGSILLAWSQIKPIEVVGS